MAPTWPGLTERSVRPSLLNLMSSESVMGMVSQRSIGTQISPVNVRSGVFSVASKGLRLLGRAREVSPSGCLVEGMVLKVVGSPKYEQSKSSKMTLRRVAILFEVVSNSLRRSSKRMRATSGIEIRSGSAFGQRTREDRRLGNLWLGRVENWSGWSGHRYQDCP